MGGNNPLRGLRWWERGGSTGMKYGARWSGPFIIWKGHTGEDAPWEESREPEEWWENVCLHFYTKVLKAELGAWPEHGVQRVCVHSLRALEGVWTIMMILLACICVCVCSSDGRPYQQ